MSLILQPSPFAGAYAGEVFLSTTTPSACNDALGRLIVKTVSPSLVSLEIDSSAMFLRNLLCESQSKSDSALPSLTHERQKYLLTQRFRDSRAIVGNSNTDRSLVFVEAQGHPGRTLAALRRLAGVQQQIVNSAAEFFRVDPCLHGRKSS